MRVQCIAFVFALASACNRGGATGSSNNAPQPVAPTPTPPANEPAPAPAEAAPPPRPAPLVAAISVGTLHACALLRDHTIRCWGANATGQLGDGTTTDRRLPLPVTDLTDATQVSAGGGHTCAVLEGGAVKCWGDNHAGQLGEGTTGEHDLPHDVDGLAEVVEVSAGASHTCARKRDGSVMCWGENASGQLGDGTHTQQTHPVAMRGVAGAQQVVAGDGFTCVRLALRGGVRIGGSVVRCFGAPLRSFGEAGRAPMGALHGAMSIAANGSGMCATMNGGAIRCFDSLASPPASPPDTRSIHGVEVAVSAGMVPRFDNGLPAPPRPQAIVCARAEAGTVQCGGDGERGQVGNGQTQSAASAGVTGVRDVVQIAAGGESGAANGHACGVVCALDRAGAVRCWGCNEHGVVGDGTVTDRNGAVAVSW